MNHKSVTNYILYLYHRSSHCISLSTMYRTFPLLCDCQVYKRVYYILYSYCSGRVPNPQCGASECNFETRWTRELAIAMLKGRNVRNQRIKCESWELFISGVKLIWEEKVSIRNLMKLGGKKTKKCLQTATQKQVNINKSEDWLPSPNTMCDLLWKLCFNEATDENNFELGNQINLFYSFSPYDCLILQVCENKQSWIQKK